MRAGLVANTVHVPDTWGGWRVYQGQATAAAGLGSPEHYRRISEMIDDAIGFWLGVADPRFSNSFKQKWATQGMALRHFYRGLSERRQRMSCWSYVLKDLLSGSWAAREHLRRHFGHEPRWPESAPERVRRWLASAGVDSPLRELPSA